MAKTSSIAKANKKPKFSVRQHNRCHICGRPRAFLRKFGICRLCFRGSGPEGRDSRGHEVELVKVVAVTSRLVVSSPSRLVLSQALMKRWREEFARKLTGDDLRRYKA